MQLCLLTAVHTDLAAHLCETAGSVRELRVGLAGSGIEVLWHVVVDGEGKPPARLGEADTWNVPGCQIGVSAARNLALSAAGNTGWVFRLDGDDTLEVEGWKALLADPHFGSTSWHPTNLVDQHGRPTPHWFTEPRLWELREVEENWTSPMAFHPNNVVVRAKLAHEVGGWPALQVNEDILWCFALNRADAGMALPHVTLRYRCWESQTVSGARYAADKARAFRFIESETNAERLQAGLLPIEAPAPGAGTLYPPAGRTPCPLWNR